MRAKSRLAALAVLAVFDYQQAYNGSFLISDRFFRIWIQQSQ